MPRTVTLGLTFGDPAGIGPELVAAALQTFRSTRGLILRPFGSTRGVTPGKLSTTSARHAQRALEDAVAAWRQGEIDGVVTAPIHKENLDRIGFGFPGHTEFIAHACGRPESDAVMMLTDQRLTVSLVTIHCALTEAIRALSIEKISQTTRATHLHFLHLKKKAPRLALAGLNPHAGENGLFGTEEQTILQPAVAALQAEGIQLTGPYAPDTIFYRALRGEFDAVICLYHDQGLIPFKLLAFHTGVNVTLGLPLIRTSPDHGTALDLVGTGRADPRSFFAALRLAWRLAKNAPPATSS